MDQEKLQEIIKASSFTVHDGLYVYAKVAAAPDPQDCFMISIDTDEITAVVRQEKLDRVELLERNKDDYRLIELKVLSLPFYAVGFLAAVTHAISSKGGNNLIVSTYSKDYVLVRDEQLQLAIDALAGAEFTQAPR